MLRLSKCYSTSDSLYADVLTFHWIAVYLFFHIIYELKCPSRSGIFSIEISRKQIDTWLRSSCVQWGLWFQEMQEPFPLPPCYNRSRMEPRPLAWQAFCWVSEQNGLTASPVSATAGPRDGTGPYSPSRLQEGWKIPLGSRTYASCWSQRVFKATYFSKDALQKAAAWLERMLFFFPSYFSSWKSL